MPIVDLMLVGSPRPGLARAVADALGQALGAPPGRVWVRLRSLAPGDYAENHVALDEADGPAFVTLLHARPPTGAQRVDEVMRVTAAVAACLGRPPDRVHLEYAPAGAGRMAFGGRLVE